MAVVCSHIRPLSHAAWLAPFGLGGMGVEFFFLLSGFIILHVHRQEVGRPDTLPRYAWRRTGRIFSTYWLVLLGVIILDQVLVGADTRARIDGAFLLREVLLLPGGSPFVGPAWTLRHELLFYALFATLMIHRRLGMAVIAVWMVAIIAALPVLGFGMAPTRTLFQIAFHHYNLDFMLGMAAALAAVRRKEGYIVAGAAVMAVILLGLWVAGGLRVDSPLQVFGYKALFLAVLGGAVVMSRGPVKAPSLAVLLGSASYSIYLLNRDVGFMAERVLRRLGQGDRIGSWPAFAVSVTIAAVAGLVVYFLYEKPVVRWVNTRPWARHRSPVGRQAAPAPDQSSSSSSFAFAPLADRRTSSPSTSATRPIDT